MSTFKNAPELGPQLQAIRKEHKLTLEQLAERSSVSKSMLSQIERGQTNPTFATLWNLTQALGVAITDLMGEGSENIHQASRVEHVQSNFTPMMKSSDGQCTLKILSPVSSASKMEWYDMEILPKGTLDSQPHTMGTIEHLTCLKGALQVVTGQMEFLLKAGDTLRYPADVQHCIKNVGKTSGHALLVVVS